MIVSMQKWMKRMQFVIVFLALTYLMVHIFGWVSDWIAPIDRYKEPQGKALKVFHQDTVTEVEHRSMKDRLQLFLWYGE